MRIEGIEQPSVLQLAAQVSYVDVKKLNGKVRQNAISDNTGSRFLYENNFRGLDLYEITKMLQLSGKNNKILLLRLLQRGDLLDVIRLMDKGLIINGLRLFSKEKLLRLMMMLPKELLLKMLFSVLKMKDFIKMMPMTEIMNILKNKKLTNRFMLEGFHYMDPKYLHFLLMKLSGQEVGHLRHAEMMTILFDSKKHQILEAMKKLPYKALFRFIQFFAEKDPTILNSVSQGFLFDIFSRMPKGSLLEMMDVLPVETLMKVFVSQMPDNLLVLMASQIDENMLSDYLVSAQPGLLAMIAGLDAA